MLLGFYTETSSREGTSVTSDSKSLRRRCGAWEEESSSMWRFVGGDTTPLRCSGPKDPCAPCRPELELQDSLGGSGARHR